MTARAAGRAANRRRGFVLIVVMVTVALLSLSLYTFSEAMLVEYEATRAHIRQRQQALIAQSAVERIAHGLASRDMTRRGELLNGVDSLRHEMGELEGLAAVHLLVRPVIDRSPYGASRIDASDFPQAPHGFEWGLGNESAKLNLNGLPLELSRADEARSRLTALPGIDLAIADAILDWMDEDDDRRPLGAESDYYTSLGYRPRQSRFRSVDELLQVRGITPELLFGEDTNGNGWLDLSETDGDRDQQLDAGLRQWLTVTSAESNYGRGGVKKVSLNAKNLATVYDRLAPVIGKEAARFIVAYRLEGPVSQTEEQRDDAQERLRRLDSGQTRLETQLDQSADTSQGARPSFAKSTERAGLDVSRQGAFKIRSLMELIGAKVVITIGAEEKLLESPWEPDALSVARALATLNPLVTFTDEEVMRHRVNVASAPRAVLGGLPFVTDAQVSQIVAARRRIRDRGAAPVHFQTVAWLMSEAGIPFEQMQRLGPHITAGGDVFSGFAIGTLEGSRSQSVVAFQIDASRPKPTVQKLQNLRPIPSTQP